MFSFISSESHIHKWTWNVAIYVVYRHFDVTIMKNNISLLLEKIKIYYKILYIYWRVCHRNYHYICTDIKWSILLPTKATEAHDRFFLLIYLLGSVDLYNIIVDAAVKF